MSATDDKSRLAKVRAGQELLFPQSARQLSDAIGLKWWVTLKLHADGWLSFHPEKASALNEPQEHELRFVGSLVTGGCDDAMLARLLAGLEKPYCYRRRRGREGNSTLKATGRVRLRSVAMVRAAAA